MILMTMIARVADALPLAASIQEDEQVSRNNFYDSKRIFKKLNISSFYFNSWAKTSLIIKIRQNVSSKP